MGATNNLLDVVLLEILNFSWCTDSAVIFRFLFNASLAERVQTPGVDVAILLDSEAVIIAATNVDDGFSLQAELTRNESANGGTGDDSAGKLALLTRSPGEDFAFVVSGEDVIGAAGHFDDVLELWDEHWSVLILHGWTEAQSTLIILQMSESLEAYNMGRTYSECAPTIYSSGSSESEGGIVTGIQRSNPGAFWEVVHVDLSWFCL